MKSAYYILFLTLICGCGSGTATPTNPPPAPVAIPIWQDDAKLKEYAHQMYRKSDGNIDEKDAMPLARAIYKKWGESRGVEILSTLESIASQTGGKPVVKYICEGNSEMTKGTILVMQLTYHHTLTNVESADCTDAINAVNQGK